MKKRENSKSKYGLLAAVMSVGLFTIPGGARAVTLFQDDFSNDTATFAYPDASGFHLPGTPSGPGSWSYNYANYEMIQAGVITNPLPGGGEPGELAAIQTTWQSSVPAGRDGPRPISHPLPVPVVLCR